jgi:HEAT repeat protein
VPWLGELLRSPDQTNRANAIYALQFTASPRAIPLLIDAVGDRVPDLALAAQGALVQLTHHSFNPKQIVPSDTIAAHSAWVRW